MSDIRVGEWLINTKGLMRRVASFDGLGGTFEGGERIAVSCQRIATLDDAFRLARVPKPKGSMIVQAFGELVALRDDGQTFMDSQAVLTQFRLRTIQTGSGPMTLWEEDGTFGKRWVIDLSRLPLADAVPALPAYVLAFLEPTPGAAQKEEEPGGSEGGGS